jgi:alcohol dehydrogenase class IV
VAVNTTAGTSSEVTINYVITDEKRKVKMVMVDKNSLALISVNDPELMVGKPAELTATTGMDALTHAIEALVTPGAYPVTDATALAAVELIFRYLPDAVEDGQNIEAREKLGVCNAMLLPYVQEANAQHVPRKFRPIAQAIGFQVRGRTDEECAEFVVDAIRGLSQEVGIPKRLSELGVTEPDLDLLADNAMKDACAPGNPFQPTKEEVIALFQKIL